MSASSVPVKAPSKSRAASSVPVKAPSKTRAASSVPVKTTTKKLEESGTKQATEEELQRQVELKKEFDVWLKRLVFFIFEKILTRIIPKTKDEPSKDYAARLRPYVMRNSETGFSRLGVWIEAFTDPSMIEPVNYERMESLGDSTIDLALMTMFVARYPNASPDDLSNLITRYRSNIVFASLVKNVLPDMVDLLRVDPRITVNDSIRSDNFEAMLGALYTASNDILPGLGAVNCNILIASLLTEWFAQGGDFDPNKMKKDSRSIIDGIFLRILGSSKSNAVKPQHHEEILVGNRVKVSATITHVTVNFLSEMNQEIGLPAITMESLLGEDYLPIYDTEPITYSVTADTEPEARQAVYDIILDIFTRSGITSDWARRVKTLLIIRTLSEETAGALERKMKEDGYAYVEFHKVGKHTIEGRQTVVILKMGRGIENEILTDVAVGVSTADVANENSVRGWVGLPPIVSRAGSIKGGRQGRRVREDRPRTRTSRRRQAQNDNPEF